MMEQKQHFALRWNDYKSSLVEALDGLRADEDFVDVTISCHGRQFKAHKMILSACSPYFRKLLLENPCSHPIIILREARANDLEAMLDFIYNGEVNVEEAQLDSFLKAATELQIRGLTEVNKTLAPGPSTAAGKKRKIRHHQHHHHHMEPEKKRIVKEETVDIRDLFEPVVGIEASTTPVITPTAAPNTSAYYATTTTAEKPAAVVTVKKQIPLVHAQGQQPQQPPEVKTLDLKQFIDDERKSCLVCGKVMRTRNSLLDHVKVHSGETQCALCGRVFSTSGNLKRHREKAHNNVCTINV